MSKPLNPEKSKHLRPLRIILAVLTVVLIILILDKLPTSRANVVKSSGTGVLSAEETSEKFYFMTGFLDHLESSLERRLEELGVPEEEYENIAEYLSKDEIFEIETKVTLASELEGNYVEATEDDLDSLRKIFGLSETYPFEIYRTETTPEEYKNLSDLIKEYHKTLITVEDYDVIE